MKNCEIDRNADTGVSVVACAKPELIDNDIHDNGGSGIHFQVEDDGGLAERNDLDRNGRANFGNGSDITVFGSFAPTLISNTCSREGSRSELGDLSGIMFFSRSELPDSPTVEGNRCAVAWCSTPSYSVLDMTCESE